MAERFSRLKLIRKPYLDRARECAELTIPSLMPPDHSPGEDYNLVTPYQSIGSAGVHMLASKLLLSLFPPNVPFFRLRPDEQELYMAAAEVGADPIAMKDELEAALADIEKATMNEMETGTLRCELNQALLQLVCCGNALMFYPHDEEMVRLFKLDCYVTDRTPDGRLLEIIIKEGITCSAVSEEIREACFLYPLTETGVPQVYDLFTVVKWNEKTKKWDYHQDINGFTVPDSEGTYTKDKFPYLALRSSVAASEPYGRGFVEQYLGDLFTAEGLAKGLYEYAAAAAKILFMVANNSTTKVKDIAEAKNLAVIRGNAADVGVLSVDKLNDFQVVKATLDDVTHRLNHAFLMTSSIQRNAERVTAEEFRTMAQELESALGGLYSVLAQEFQLPLVRLQLNRMQHMKQIPPLPKSVKPAIVTGLDALGRGSDVERLRIFIRDVTALGDNARATLDDMKIVKQLGVGTGIKVKDIMKTAEQLAQEQQAAQQAQMQAEQLPINQELVRQGGQAVNSMLQKGMPNG